MGTRSESLAAKVEQSFADLLAAVEASTREQWTARCSDGEWTQGFAAFHAATYIGPIAQTVRSVADGQPFPMTSMEAIDAENAVQAKEHTGCTKAETIDLIKGAAPAAVNIVKGLSDAQLDRKAQVLEGMPEVTIEMFVQMAVIGHAAYHLGTITGARLA